MMRILILSGPGDFLMGIDMIVRRISSSETATNLKASGQRKAGLLTYGLLMYGWILLSSDSFLTA